VDNLIWKRVTGLIIAGSTIGLLLYDVLAYVFGANISTISNIFLNINKVSPIFMLSFSYLMGMLTGHFFLPQTT